MPIYEFLCPNCNRVYSFLSQSYNPTKTPKCPKCSSENMTKQISRFSFIRAAAGGKRSGPHDQAEPSDFGGPGGPGGFGGPGGPGGFGGPGGPGGPGGYGGQGEGGPDPFDDPRVEREMMRLMSQAEHLDENDPRQLGAFMRRMTEIAGEDMEPEMEEAIREIRPALLASSPKASGAACSTAQETNQALMAGLGS